MDLSKLDHTDFVRICYAVRDAAKLSASTGHRHQARLLIFAEKILRKCKCQPNLLHEDKRACLNRQQNKAKILRGGLS